MITVTHSRDLERKLIDEIGETVIVYCGRKFAGFPSSPLANPFPIKQYPDAMERYRAWLWKEIQSEEGEAWGMMRWLVELEKMNADIYLGCWCSPNPCHCDIIKAAILAGVKGDIAQLG